MKKIMVALLGLLLLIPTLSLADTSARNFVYGAGVRFGMSLAEVKAVDGDAETEASDMLLYNATIAGQEGYVAYLFTKDMLTQIFISFSAEHQNDNDFITDFENVDVSLRAKYGQPSIDNYYCWDDGAKESLSGGYGLAIKEEYLLILSSWDENGVSIDHMVSGDGNAILHSISYAPMEAETETDVNTDGL